jgi:hypothetical protein
MPSHNRRNVSWCYGLRYFPKGDPFSALTVAFTPEKSGVHSTPRRITSRCAKECAGIAPELRSVPIVAPPQRLQHILNPNTVSALSPLPLEPLELINQTPSRSAK